MSETVLRGTEGKITDEMIESMRAEIGKEYPAKEQWNTRATTDAIRHWAQGFGDLNPLWLDEEYAKKTRFGGIIAPPTFLFSCSGRAGRFGFPGIHGLYTGARWVLHKPVHAETPIKSSGGVHDLVEKKSRFARRGCLVTAFWNFRDGQGELLATLYQGTMRLERDTAVQEGKYKDLKLHVYTEAELQEIWKGIEAEEVRGATPRYWEDVVIGQELTPVVKGPLTISDCIAAKMAFGSHFVHHIRANETRYWVIKRHPKLPIRNRLNVPDSPEGVHMATETASAIGIPAWYDYGYQRVAWGQHLVTNWIGDDGWVKEFEVQVRLPNIEGDTLWYRGNVSRKWMEGAEHLAEIQMRAENQRGEIVAPGWAIVSLPSRGG